MADDLLAVGQPATIRINITEPYALRYWTKELNVTEQQLRDAMAIVGTLFVDVKQYLRKH